MIRLLLTVVFAFLSLLTHISAQLVLVSPTLNNLQPGQLIDIPIRVKNFTNIVGLQFPVKWDPAVLQYQNVNGFGLLPSVTISNNFGLGDTTAGIVRFNWYGSAISKPDLSILLKIKVKVIGAVNSSTQITFPTNVQNFPIEVVDYDPVDSSTQEIAVNFEIGTAAVGFTVGIDDAFLADQSAAIDVFPNPFSSKLNIFPKNKSGIESCQISVRDIAGRIVFHNQQTRLPSAGMEIDMDGLSQGIYFLIINTEHETIVRKLMMAE